MPEGGTNRVQSALIDFLRVDMGAAFTFLQTARIERSSDERHYKAAVEKAQAALKTIRYLSGRVENPEERAAITRQADELEAAIAKV